MKNSMNILWISIAAILIGVLLWFGLGGGFGSSQEVFDEEYTDWDYDLAFNPHDKNPYGTYVLRELMDTGFAGVRLKLIQTNLDLSKLVDKDSAIYLFIGHHNFLEKESVDELMEFVKNGSSAFLSFSSIPEYLEYKLFEQGIDKANFTTMGNIPRFRIEGSSSHKVPFILDNDTIDFDWNYFKESGFFSFYTKLGYVEDKVDFIKLKHGKGYFYLHLNPYVFTNVNILNEDGLLLAEEIFSTLPKGDVYWDIYSMNSNNEEYQEKRSVIEFILNNRSLRWAFISLLIGVLIFGLFAAKRYFKAIPIVKPNDNTSLEFVETISRLYLTQGENSDLIQIKKENFQNFVSHHYYLPKNDFKGDFIFKLAQKSNISEQEIEALIKKLNFGSENKNISNDYLIETHKMLEHFYQNCKGVQRKQEIIATYKDIELQLMRKTKGPLSIIGAGGVVLFIGLILLTLGLGFGTLLILVGLIGAIIGYVLFSTPIISIHSGELTYQKWFKTEHFSLRKLESNKYQKETGVFTLNSNSTKIEIDLNDLNAKDQDKLVNTIRNIKK
jgi:hypothetical protein